MKRHTQPSRPERFRPVLTLQNHEYAVFLLLGDGLKPSAVARESKANAKTVDTWIANTAKKIGVSDTCALRAYAARFIERIGKPRILRSEKYLPKFVYDP